MADTPLRNSQPAMIPYAKALVHLFNLREDAYAKRWLVVVDLLRVAQSLVERSRRIETTDIFCDEIVKLNIDLGEKELESRIQKMNHDMRIH